MRKWAIASAALLAALAVLVVGQAATGFATRFIPLGSGAVDPTLETLDWGALRAAPAVQSAAFVVATKWMDGGKVGLALGPDKPIFVFSDDPRGIAFLSDSADFVGRDAAIVVAWDRREATEARLAPYFAGFDPPQQVDVATRRARRNRAGGHSGARLDARLSPAVSALRPPRESRARLERARDDIRSGGA